MIKKFYTSSLFLAVMMHLLLGVVLFVSLDTKAIIANLQSKPEPEPVKTIDAVAIDVHQLDKEVARLDAIDRNKKLKEQQRQKALALKAKQEQDRIAKLQAEKQRLAEETKKQEELQKLVDQARLAKLQKEKEELEQISKAKEQALKEKQEAEVKAAEQRKLAEAERLKAEEQRKQAEEARKKEEELAKQREAERQQRLAEEKRQRDLEEKERQARAQKVTQSQINQYAALIKSRIHQNWRLPVGLDVTGKECEVNVKISSTGEVLKVIITNSSGDKEFDRSTELAVLKSSPFPLPSDEAARNQFDSFTFLFKPEGV